MDATSSSDGDGSCLETAGVGADVERLTRWRTAGGEWRVIVRSARGITIALLTCDGGEEIDRIVSTDPGLLSYIGSRSCDES